MKILVTGGAGYIGSHVVHLLKDNHEIVVYDSLVKGYRHNVPENVQFIKGCLSNIKLLGEVFSKHKFDAVLHLAGSIEVSESMKIPEKYFENNTVNSLNLLNLMKKFSVKKIVFASTAAVYGNPETLPLIEAAKKEPTNYYGLSKLMIEQILDSFSKVYGIKNVCLRFFNAAGAAFGLTEEHSPETHLIPLILQAAKSRGSVKIFGTDYDTKDGTCVRDYVHVLDIARAHELALNLLNNGSEGKFNLGTNTGFTVKEVVETVKAVTHLDFNVIETERREGDPPVLVASNVKAKKVLKWQPEYGLKEIVQSAWGTHSKKSSRFKA